MYLLVYYPNMMMMESSTLLLSSQRNTPQQNASVTGWLGTGAGSRELKTRQGAMQE
jgi:hypothetical protein